MAKIFIIDDDVTPCNLVEAYLARLQHETLGATDGIKGLITVNLFSEKSRVDKAAKAPYPPQ